ncbi:MAG: YfbM family protein [Flavobacteriales bacterium]
MGMIINFLRIESDQLNIYKEDSSKLEDRIYNDEIDNDPNFIDIDKSWDGIIFLLTGQNVENASGEMLKIIFSGNLIDEEQDLGYGPAHYLNSNEVTELNFKLKQINMEELKAKFDANKMKQIGVYPDIWDEGASAMEYLIDYFEDLRNFYSEAALNKQAIISVLN